MAILKPRDPSVIAIIQARMGSSRLPGKVLMEMGGKPMLFHVVLRARRAKWLGRVIVATTVEPDDDPVAKFCQTKGIPCFRGDAKDVLDRYYQAALRYEAGTIVRLTADCPLIDSYEIDRTVQAFFDGKVDFAANRLPPPWKRTIPIGMDTEVVTFDALERAWREAKAIYEREHVMPYLYDREGRFKILLVDHDPDLGHLRLTVDTPEDLSLVRQIFDHFEPSDEISLGQIRQLLEKKPELLKINANVSHKTFKEIDQRR